MSKKRAALAAMLAVIVALAAMHGTVLGREPGSIAQTDPAPSKARVLVKDNYFEPRSTEVKAGGLVMWKWRGMNRHNIRFTKVPEGASRKGASVRTEGRWKRKFKRPGVYRYVCKVWSGMRGSVTVRAEPEPKPQS
jgi:plastocyanin